MKNQVNEIIVVLHGGDGELIQQLVQIAKALEDRLEKPIIKTSKVGYVAIALEPLVGENKPIEVGGVENTFKTIIQPFFFNIDADEVILITSNNIEDMFSCDLVIVSGGDTEYLLKTLDHHKIAQTLKVGQHQIKTIAGISAGAIALAEHGVGTKDGQEVVFDGMDLFPGTVIPHASSYPDFKSKYGDSALGLENKVIIDVFLCTKDSGQD